AYVVPDGDVRVGEIHAYAVEHLPSYMVPSAVCFIDAIPRTAWGKVDRRALPKPETVARSVPSSPSAPGSELEGTIVSVFRDIFGRSDIGPDDDFVQLGGHSLVAIRILGVLHQALGREVPISWLFEEATPAKFAARIEREVRT